MDLDLEQQLTNALAGRASALPLPPSDLAGVRSRARSIRRRRVAAGTAASAAVVALVVPVAWGLGGLRGADQPTPVAPAPATLTTSPAKTCSSTGVARPTPPTDLPAPVLATWQRLVDAAAACDAAAVQAIAGQQTALSVGGGPRPDLQRLEEQGRGRLGILLKLLGLSHAENTQAPPGSYAWPAAYTRPDWAAVPQAERDELRAIHTTAEISGFAAFGGYSGWRVGIAADGTWQFFVAGD
jgi:hypothetical protein